MRTQSKVLFALIGLALSAFLAGCGGGDSSNGSNSNLSSASYSYLFCNNCSDGNGGCATDQSQCAGGCTTGAHSSDSLSSICAQLSTPSPNNSCDSNDRQQLFNQLGCSGSFSG